MMRFIHIVILSLVGLALPYLFILFSALPLPAQGEPARGIQAQNTQSHHTVTLHTAALHTAEPELRSWELRNVGLRGDGIRGDELRGDELREVGLRGDEFRGWETLPVFHNGRVMPLHTFARKIVRDICGTERPFISRPPINHRPITPPVNHPVNRPPAPGTSISMGTGTSAPAGALPITERPIAEQPITELPIAERIEQRIPPGGRHFAPSELLFFWMTEPDVWEPIMQAFLQSQFTSPAEVQTRQRHWSDLTFHPDRQHPARMLSLLYQTVEIESSSYWPALQTWGHLLAWGEFPDRQSLDPRSDAENLHPTTQRWHDIAEELFQIMEMYDLPDGGESPGIVSPGIVTPRAVDAERHFERIIVHLDANLAEAAVLLGLMYPGVAYREAEGLESAELETAELESGREIDSILPRLMLPHNQPHHQAIRRGVLVYYYLVKKLRKEIEAVSLALYDNGTSFRFLPLGSPIVLEKGLTDNQFGVQPWASATMILESGEIFTHRFFGVDALPNILRLRQIFGRPALARPALGQNAEPESKRAPGGEGLAQTIRRAAESIERQRTRFLDADSISTNMPLAEHLEKTAYPPAESYKLWAEFRYDKLHPFYWMWVFAVLSVVSCACAYAVSRKPPEKPDRTNTWEERLFFVSVFMLTLSMLIAFLGGVMRATISGWAPITNMYETVVMTAFLAAVLGMWYALSPIFQPAWRLAWEYSRFPSKGQPAKSFPTFILSAFILPLVRLLLMFAVLVLIAVFASGNDYVVEFGLAAAAANLFSTNDVIDLLTVIASVALLVWFTPHVLLALGLMPMILMRPALLAAEHSGNTTQWLNQIRNSILNRKLFIAVTASIVFIVGLIAWLNHAEFNPDIRPIAAVLRSNFWLTVHVIAILISYAAVFIAWGMAVVSLGYVLLGRYQRVQSGGQHPHILLPEMCLTLSPIIERLLKIALLLLIVGTVLGARWADYSWGRFWSWDPKEVWALITILFLVIVLHGKTAKHYGPIGIIAGALFASIAVIITWYGINFIFSGGRHTYGGGSANSAAFFAGTFIACNLLWGTLALLRHYTVMIVNKEMSKERY